MKNGLAKKSLIWMLLVMLMLLSLTMANAGVSTNAETTYPNTDGDLAERLRYAPEFKFWHLDNGIGYGSCPVYTAPSENAFRCANGKASCDTNSKMAEAGFVGNWLLVQYETNNGGVRVGYIPPRYIGGYVSKMGTPQFENIPVTAADTIYVTDNPLVIGSSFARLDPGEPFYILGKYTYLASVYGKGDWWYIECTVDNQRARGFIDRNTASFYLGIAGYGQSPQSVLGQPVTLATLGNPPVSPLGTTQIGEVTIQHDERIMVRKNADPTTDVVSAAYPGKTYPCYAVKKGSTGKDWYYIWVEKDSVWGWVSSGLSVLR